MPSARFGLNPVGPGKSRLQALAQAWMAGLRHKSRHTVYAAQSWPDSLHPLRIVFTVAAMVSTASSSIAGVTL